MNGELTEGEGGGDLTQTLIDSSFKDDFDVAVGSAGFPGVDLPQHVPADEPGSPVVPMYLAPQPSHLRGEELLQKVRNKLPTATLEAADSTIASPSDHSTVSSPGLQSPCGIHTPRETDVQDINTQMSLIEDYARVHLDDSISAVENRGTMWGGHEERTFQAISTEATTSSPHLEGSLFNLDDVAPVVSSPPASISTTSPPSVHFTFTKFGRTEISDKKNGSTPEASKEAAPRASSEAPVILDGVVPVTVSKARSTKTGLLQKSARRREPSLTLAYPSKNQKWELQILAQPEDQHRARYLTEGSRGAIKDMTGQGHPMVKLVGCEKPVVLQIFIGTDSGKVKPHGFYQACKVSGKNSTPCVEKDVEGTTVIEIQLDPNTDMTALVDCVGILKLRNADVEQRIGLSRSKKKSTKARLVFRVNIPKADGLYDTLQVASTPILCTQPAGAPEISKMSSDCGSVEGGAELFIIGKNFMKGTKVTFDERQGGAVVWSKEAELDPDYFHPTHLICKIPPYHDQDIRLEAKVEIVVHSSGKGSEPVPYTYKPIKAMKEEAPVPMETEPSLAQKVSPVALALNRSCQQSLVSPFMENTESPAELSPLQDPDLDPPMKLVRVEDPEEEEPPAKQPFPASVACSAFSQGLTDSFKSPAAVLSPVEAPTSVSFSADHAPQESICLKREHTGEQKTESSRFPPPESVPSVPASFSFSSAGLPQQQQEQQQPALFTSSTTVDPQVLNLLQQKDSLQPHQLQELLAKIIPAITIPASSCSSLTSTFVKQETAPAVTSAQQSMQGMPPPFSAGSFGGSVSSAKASNLLEESLQPLSGFEALRAEKPMDTGADQMAPSSASPSPFESLKQSIDKMDAPKDEPAVDQPFAKLLHSLHSNVSTSSIAAQPTFSLTSMPPSMATSIHSSSSSSGTSCQSHLINESLLTRRPTPEAKPMQLFLIKQPNEADLQPATSSCPAASQPNPTISLSPVDQQLLQSLTNQQQQQNSATSSAASQQPIQSHVLQQFMSHLGNTSQASDPPAQAASSNTLLLPMVLQQSPQPPTSSQVPTTAGFQFPTLLPQTISSTVGGANMNTVFLGHQQQAPQVSTPSSSGQPMVSTAGSLRQNTPIFLLTQGQNGPSIVQVAQPQVTTLNAAQLVLASQLLQQPPSQTPLPPSHAAACSSSSSGSPLMSTQQFVAQSAPPHLSVASVPTQSFTALSGLMASSLEGVDKASVAALAQSLQQQQQQNLMEHSGMSSSPVVKQEAPTPPPVSTPQPPNAKKDTILYHLLIDEQSKQGAVNGNGPPPQRQGSSDSSDRLPSLTVDEVDLLLNTQAATFTSQSSQN